MTRSPRTRRERGAVAVEAALITPFFIMLLVGIIEFGMFFKDYLSVASAVRAGARTASAEPRMTTYAQDAVNSVMAEGTAFARGNVQEMWVYKANPTNKYPVGASNFTGGCTTCIKFTWNGTTFSPTYSNWLAANQSACAKSSTNPAGPDRVGVYMKVRHNAFTKFVFTSITIEDTAVLSFEPKPSTQTCS